MRACKPFYTDTHNRNDSGPKTRLAICRVTHPIVCMKNLNPVFLVKVNKLNFLQQLGFWHLNDACMGEQGQKLLEGDTPDGSLSGRCCSKEAIVTCHFSDKPSSEKCKDSGAPNIDKRGRVFWQK